ncbi:MAG: VWA domain-containing protein [Candidatus Thiodiazotropha endolucinida]|nr:VWA domain-containing protein [Candidatus Thiodiazotropha taylori]MCG8095262.1 VWA domain-containing protein [Candidatus Thiodiazotropha endolucinida]MCG8061978.1 VWA domain-containing protein [Candidatus Thiodiazotropha taylori]MCG8063077.1 VWA domain-containing protein [Candidatus Thiodiazotropha taylori]MCW4329156.1 VWA domain-containing protein [Candidatus Thiodiazotropha endolucinida]
MATLKSILTLLICILFPSLLQGAAQQHPLLMEGKQALYQRVLSKPGAHFYKEIQQTKGDPATPFSVFYVYKRKIENGSTTWLQLGHNRHGEIAGWMPETNTIPWNQGLTVAFRDPLGNDRVLLFNEKAKLKALISSDDKEKYQQLYQAAESGELDTNSPVIAIQPRTHVDILKDFYLVPIRDHEDIYIGNEQARMLQVSSVPLLPPPAVQEKAPRAEKHEIESDKIIKPFRSAVVFVIDSTLSMDPYIDRTREAVRKIYDTITKEDLTGDVSFGLIAFRDNPQAVPGLGYLTQTYVDLRQGQDADGFFNQVSSLKAATVSSRDFNEDSYAGVNEAIAGIDWQEQDARYVVLITDAGPREAGDPLSGTGMSSASLRQLAQDKGIALSVLHLLTPSIMADHTKAEETYRDLSYYPGIGSFYFGVETGDVERFGRVLDALAKQITEQVKLAALAAAGKSMAMERQARENQTTQDEETDQLAQFQAKVAKLGYALRMRYLQQKDKRQIPNVFNAWLVDRDINEPQRQTLDVRVLLTRDQLSDLHSIMHQVLITAEEGLLSPRTFLNDLKSLAATIARDPEQLGTTTRVTGAREGNLADMGFMREYIEDLPYTGEVMNLSLENWQDWPARDQIRFINRLEEKINYYQVLHDHTDLWISLDGGPISGDSVFPIALEMLP